ncbi:MAG: sigma-70 family RNA polymerase sigma factor [Acidobacteriota bacterium]
MKRSIADNSDMKVVKNGEEEYKKIINDNIGFIEKQCLRVISMKSGSPAYGSLNIENESDLLFSTVIDKLQESDFRILRNFKGRSKLSTYLTTIISNTAVDYLRGKRGRNREKERSKKFGKTGELIYSRIFENGEAIDGVYRSLSSEGLFKGDASEFENVVLSIRGRGRDRVFPVNDSAVKAGSYNGESGNFVIRDDTKGPESSFIDEETDKRSEEILKKMRDSLSGEESLLLRMKYPVEENETPVKVKEISLILGISQKAVYKKMNRILKKCKNILESYGVSINDFF